MADVLSDDGSGSGHDDSQEDVMTPAELIAKLEEVSEEFINMKPCHSDGRASCSSLTLTGCCVCTS